MKWVARACEAVAKRKLDPHAVYELLADKAMADKARNLKLLHTCVSSVTQLGSELGTSLGGDAAPSLLDVGEHRPEPLGLYVAAGPPAGGKELCPAPARPRR